jgi:phosphoribosylanthranilate isomerase
MLKTKIKASQVTNLTDARYFAAWEAEWIGFNFEKGTDTFIEPQKMSAIREWIEGSKIVGEFGMATPDDINATATALALDAVQLPHFATLETAAALQHLSIIKTILVLPDEDNSDLLATMTAFSPFTNTFLIDFLKNDIPWKSIKAGTFLPFETLKTASEQFQVILNVALDPATLREILEVLPNCGLNITGSEEEKVGFKSFDAIDELFDILFL